jgi:hypothetical protein
MSPPPLGSRVFDRVGRPAVNSALIGIFAPRGEKDLAQQRYNTTEPEGWEAHAQEIAKNLPLYDALDGVCGNQVLAGAAPEPGRYDVLAGALADDRLYLDTDASSCGQYLAVELDATQVAPNQDCGGRDPRYDVIDVTYSALAAGSVSGVSDGVDADPEPLLDEFPFFAR